MTLTTEGYTWAISHADSLVARVALMASGETPSDWPRGHQDAAVRECNEAGAAERKAARRGFLSADLPNPFDGKHADPQGTGALICECGERVYHDHESVTLPFPWRNVSDTELHTCKP